MAIWDNWFSQPPQPNQDPYSGAGIWGNTLQQAPPEQQLGPVYGPRTSVDEWMANTPWANNQPSPRAKSPSLSDMGAWQEGGYWWALDMDGNVQRLSPVSGMYPSEELARQKFEWEQANYPQEQQLLQQKLANEQQQSAAAQQYQMQQLAAEQQWRQQQLEAERQQRLATLAAQPKSWLEYAATANQPPVVQPWMLPLMPQQYSNLQVGQPIPNWNAQNMQAMPDLTNPSAQYWARIGPTAQQQYLGYQQADIGATPQESQFRLWNMAPSGGQNRGFQQVR